MRFHTIVASAIATIAAVSAQTSDSPSTACMSCISNNMFAIPACKNVSISEVDYTSSDSTVKTCVCTLSGDLSWVTSCGGSNGCSDAYINSWKTSYGEVYKNYCSGFSANSKSAAWTMTVPKAEFALLIAIVAALL